MRLVTFLLIVPMAFLVGGAFAQTSPPPVAAAPVVVKGVSKVPVTFDGHVSKFEYGDATAMTFPNGHGTVDVWMKFLATP